MIQVWCQVDMIDSGGPSRFPGLSTLHYFEQIFKSNSQQISAVKIKRFSHSFQSW